MKIAMFIQDDKMKNIDVNAFNVLIFKRQDDTILGIENEYICNRDINYITLWLLDRKIDVVYIAEKDSEIDAYFGKFGIEIKTHEDLKDDSILKAFLM